jgi:chemotaxis protein MotB
MQGGSSIGESSQLMKGGGRDMTRNVGQVRSAKELEAEYARMEQLKFNELKHRIEVAIERNPVLRQFRNQLLLDITPEGLRVQIVDEQNRPMFAVGRAELQPYARDILLEIGHMLNTVDNKVSLAGHTDATPYASGEKGYSNWELSADRANASRRVLLAGGMEEKRVVRVVGMASAVSLDVADPHNAMNRRISLIVLSRDAVQALEKGSGPVDVRSTEDVQPDAFKEPG